MSNGGPNIDTGIADDSGSVQAVEQALQNPGFVADLRQPGMTDAAKAAAIQGCAAAVLADLEAKRARGEDVTAPLGRVRRVLAEAAKTLAGDNVRTLLFAALGSKSSRKQPVPPPAAPTDPQPPLFSSTDSGAVSVMDGLAPPSVNEPAAVVEQAGPTSGDRQTTAGAYTEGLLEELRAQVEAAASNRPPAPEEPQIQRVAGDSFIPAAPASVGPVVPPPLPATAQHQAPLMSPGGVSVNTAPFGSNPFAADMQQPQAPLFGVPNAVPPQPPSAENSGTGWTGKTLMGALGRIFGRKNQQTQPVGTLAAPAQMRPPAEAIASIRPAPQPPLVFMPPGQSPDAAEAPQLLMVLDGTQKTGLGTRLSHSLRNAKDLAKEDISAMRARFSAWWERKKEWARHHLAISAAIVVSGTTALNGLVFYGGHKYLQDRNNVVSATTPIAPQPTTSTSSTFNGWVPSATPFTSATAPIAPIATATAKPTAAPTAAIPSTPRPTTPAIAAIQQPATPTVPTKPTSRPPTRFGGLNIADLAREIPASATVLSAHAYANGQAQGAEAPSEDPDVLVGQTDKVAFWRNRLRTPAFYAAQKEFARKALVIYAAHPDRYDPDDRQYIKDNEQMLRELANLDKKDLSPINFMLHFERKYEHPLTGPRPITGGDDGLYQRLLQLRRAENAHQKVDAKGKAIGAIPIETSTQHLSLSTGDHRRSFTYKLPKSDAQAVSPTTNPNIPNVPSPVIVPKTDGGTGFYQMTPHAPKVAPVTRIAFANMSFGLTTKTTFKAPLPGNAVAMQVASSQPQAVLGQPTATDAHAVIVPKAVLMADRVIEEINPYAHVDGRHGVDWEDAQVAAIQQRQEQRAEQAPKLLASTNDERLHSDDPAVALRAMDQHTTVIEKAVAKDIADEHAEQARFETARRSRPLVDKLAAAGREAWSGTTPEQSAQGLEGTGGVRGLFMGSNERLRRLARNEEILSGETQAPKPAKAPTKTIADFFTKKSAHAVFEERKRAKAAAMSVPMAEV